MKIWAVVGDYKEHWPRNIETRVHVGKMSPTLFSNTVLRHSNRVFIGIAKVETVWLLEIPPMLATVS